MFVFTVQEAVALAVALPPEASAWEVVDRIGELNRALVLAAELVSGLQFELVFRRACDRGLVAESDRAAYLDRFASDPVGARRALAFD